MKYLRASALSAALFASMLSGCGDEDEDAGLVIVEWSLGGRLAPEDCGAIGADLLEAVFFQENGEFAGELEEQCESFEAQIFLREGTYDVTTRLITFEQEAVSSTLFFESVQADQNVNAVLHADFPEQPIP